MVRRRAVGLVALFAIMAVWIGANENRLDTAQAMMDDIGAQKSEIENVASHKVEMERARAALSDLQILLSELTGRRSLVIVFGEISRRIPEDIVLTGCRFYEPTLCDHGLSESETAPNDQRPNTASPRHTNRASASRRADAEPLRHGLTLVGVGLSIPDIIDFAAALDKSPLFVRVNMDVKEAIVYAGRPARRFELTCRIVRQEEEAP